MKKVQKTPLIYRDTPIFGLDIGYNTIKVMQISHKDGESLITGYGTTEFNHKAIEDGIVKDYEAIASSMANLFKTGLTGTISTKRAVLAIPTHKAYSRVISLPKSLAKKDIEEAIFAEVSQYIPEPLESLNIDYSVISEAEDIDFLVVAIPGKIIESYINLAHIVGVELSAIETSILSASRIITHTDNSNDVPTILIDLGSLSVDITVYDKNAVINGTIPGGGLNISQRIAKKLDVSIKEADIIKTKYGLNVSKYQSAVKDALKPQIESLIKEIKKVSRYYTEKTNEAKKIEQIITMGGGSNVPGLVEYLTDNLRVPTKICNFWDKLNTKDIPVPADEDKPLYATVAGASIINPKDIWK